MSIDVVLESGVKVQDFVDVAPFNKSENEMLENDFKNLEDLFEALMITEERWSDILRNIYILNPNSSAIIENKREINTHLSTTFDDMIYKKIIGKNIHLADIASFESKINNDFNFYDNASELADLALLKGAKFSQINGIPINLEEKAQELKRTPIDISSSYRISKFLNTLSNLVIAGLPPKIAFDNPKYLDLIKDSIESSRKRLDYVEISSFLVAWKMMNAEDVYFKDGKLTFEMKKADPEPISLAPLPERRSF